jgi:hypothetical protein
MKYTLLCLLVTGYAHADNAVPDPNGERDRFAAVAVTELPTQATLRSVMFLSSGEGCSMSHSATQDSLAMTLRIDGKRAELHADGTSRDVSGGRSSVNEHPKVYRDETHRIGGRWLGQAKIEGQTLAIDLGTAGKLACTIQKLPRDGGDGQTVSGLVCDPVDKVQLPGLAGQIPHLPFGRGAGLQSSVSFPRHAKPHDALPGVTVARL